MGGRIAEELTFSQITTGAQNDIEQATEMARKMVCEWGMSEALGPLTYGKKEEQIFLGKEFNRHQDYSEATALKIDAEIKRVVTEQYARATRLLTENRGALERVAEALLEHEVLDAQPAEAAHRGRAAARRWPPRRRRPLLRCARRATRRERRASRGWVASSRPRWRPRSPRPDPTGGGCRGEEKAPLPHLPPGGAGRARRAHPRDGGPQRHPGLLLGRGAAADGGGGGRPRPGPVRGGCRLGRRGRGVHAPRGGEGRRRKRRSVASCP